MADAHPDPDYLPHLHANPGGTTEDPTDAGGPSGVGAGGGQGVLGDGAVRAVTTGALNRSTFAVLRSLREGERLVVTRHGQPRAVVFGVRDAIELLVAPRLPELARQAQRDFEAGEIWCCSKALDRVG